MNGDGFPDLIVATGSNTAGLVGVLLNDGTGKFPTVATYSSGGLSPLALAVADVNGDGKPDVVVANQWTDNTDTSSNVSVLLNDGTGKFSTAVAYGTGGFFPDSVAIADINGDGKVDLVVANSSVGATGGLGNVGVLLGNGDGTFGTAVAHPSGSYATAVAFSRPAARTIWYRIHRRGECSAHKCLLWSISGWSAAGSWLTAARCSAAKGGASNRMQGEERTSRLR